MSPTFFGIYIDKLEPCLEEEGCVGTTSTRIVNILLLYAEDTIIFVRFPSNIEKQLRNLKYLCSSSSMSINIDKTKCMIIKTKNTSCPNYVDGNNNLEEVSSYKYLSIDVNKNLNQNYSVDKRINGRWK